MGLRCEFRGSGFGETVRVIKGSYKGFFKGLFKGLGLRVLGLRLEMQGLR